MKELAVLLFVISLVAGCAVVTPYGTSLYVPDSEIAILPYSYYSYSYYPYPWYPYAGYPYYYPWYGWRPGWASWGFTYHFHGHGGPPRYHGGYGGPHGPSRH